MSCCGQRRSAAAGVAAGEAAIPPRKLPDRPLPATPYRAVSLHYLQATPIRVRGPITGGLYEFSNTRPVQPVDARDLRGLLETGLFRRGG